MKSRLRKIRFWTRVVSPGKIDGHFRTKREAQLAAYARGGTIAKLEGFYVEPRRNSGSGN